MGVRGLCGGMMLVWGGGVFNGNLILRFALNNSGKILGCRCRDCCSHSPSLTSYCTPNAGHVCPRW